MSEAIAEKTRLYTGRTTTGEAISARRAIRLRCLDCAETETVVGSCEVGPDSHEPCPLWFCRRGPSVTKAHKGSPLKAIRAYCLWCMNGNAKLVRECDQEATCVLWPYRFGKRPKPPEEGRS